MTDDSKKPHHHHHLVDPELVASWEDSVLINRGTHPESDDIQKFVRHHRKDTLDRDTDHEDQPKEKQTEPELKDRPQKRNAA